MRILKPEAMTLAPLVHRASPSAFQLTVIVKSTLDLAAGRAAAAEEQPFPTGDVPYDDDPDGNGSVHYESDFAPFKPRADVLLVGSCFAPGGGPVESCRAALTVGSIRKEIAVFGDRNWRYRFGVLPAIARPAPFTTMPLRYERSFGGAGFAANPAGKGYGAVTDQEGRSLRLLPNLEDPQRLIASPDDRPRPGGWGPLKSTWKDRRARTGTVNQKWLKERWPCFPKDFDWSYFNAAPEDMQVEGYLRGDEEIVLENLHPDQPRFATRLPGWRVRCFVLRWKEPGGPQAGREFHEIELNLDTLWIDTDSQQLVLVWRGRTPLAAGDELDEIEYVYVAQEDSRQPPAPEQQHRDEFERRKAEAEDPPPPPEQQLIEKKTAGLKVAAALSLARCIDPTALKAEIKGGFGNGAADFPALEGMDLEQQAAALGGFSSDLRGAVDAALASSLAGRQEIYAARGWTSAGSLPPPSPETQAATAALLKQYGLDELLLKADANIKETAADLARRGVDPAAGGISLADMSRGLAGLGVSLAALGIGAAPPPLPTRDSLAAKVAAGEGLAGEVVSDLDLSGADLAGGEFENTIFSNVDLSGANLSGANLRGAVLMDIDLSGANLKEAKAAGAKLNGADLTGANLAGADLSEALLTKARLAGAKMPAAVLDGADLTAADLSGGDLSRASLIGAILQQAVLTKADLSAARGESCDFSKADISNANLEAGRFLKADFSECVMTGASLRRADLREARFLKAGGEKADFTAADLTQSRLMEAALDGGIFSQAHAEQANFNGASLKGAAFRHARASRAFFMAAALDAAVFTAADLRQARFSKASLKAVHLDGANLLEAALDGCDLTGASLRGANLYSADLLDAVTEEADLAHANIKRTVIAARGIR